MRPHPRSTLFPYTTLFRSIGTLVISPVIQKVPYDVQKDFAPLGQVVSLQNIIVVTPSLPATNLNQYVALARSKPGDMLDRKSTRLNSSHSQISYAVFCLKK